MNRLRSLAAVCAAALCIILGTTIARAVVPAPFLIATSTVDPTFEDFALDTRTPLESGIAGNRLGGTGSAIAYLGGDYFVSMPDRGPNAKVYDSCLNVNNTTSYIPRFHTWHMTLAPSDPGSTLPYSLTPMLVDTTLFHARFPLFYGAGCGAPGAPGSLPSGEPALNDIDHTHYFSGRSDNFDPNVHYSTNPYNARLDPEGIRVSNDGKFVYTSDEYGPYVYEFDRETGRRTRVFTLPQKFAVATQSSDEAVEFPPLTVNTSGRVANKGMEGLAITPDGRYLVGAMQSPLIQDGGDTKGLFTRIVKIDIRTGQMKQYAYPLDNDPAFKKTTISEILAINNTDFLVDERDGRGLADGDNSSDAQFKRLYRIHIDNTTPDVSNLEGKDNLGPKAVTKTLFLDIVAALTAKGFDAFHIPAKLEGIAFGQDVWVDNTLKHTLYVSNDNDFLPVVNVKQNGINTDTPNPNRFFVFAFSDTDLPGFVQQRFDCDDDHDGRGHGDGPNFFHSNGRGGHYLFPPFWPKHR